MFKYIIAVYLPVYKPMVLLSSRKQNIGNIYLWSLQVAEKNTNTFFIKMKFGVK